MPIFIDGHSLKGIKKDELMKEVNSPKNEHGVTPIELFYNEIDDKLYCILDGPDKDAIEKHHHDMGLKCEFVTEISQVKTEHLLREAKLAQIGELSARLSHDIRNPLTVIKTTVDILQPQLEEHMNEKMKLQCMRLDKAVQQITHQVEELMNFAKLKSLNKQHISINEILNEVIKKLAVPIDININLPKENTMVYCDKIQMDVVFVNLLQNSIDAMNNLGVIDINCTDNQKELVITVIDSGNGIPADIVPIVFDPLVTTKDSGTGLGLASCKNIIEQHNGTIDVTSQIGNGTIFTIKLPKKCQ